MIRIEPQPPEGIKYMVGGQSWLPLDNRDPRRLVCEEWGNLGPMELDSDIKPNKIGLRVRGSSFTAPKGYEDFIKKDGIYYWIKERR